MVMTTGNEWLPNNGRLTGPQNTKGQNTVDARRALGTAGVTATGAPAQAGIVNAAIAAPRVVPGTSPVTPPTGGREGGLPGAGVPPGGPVPPAAPPPPAGSATGGPPPAPAVNQVAPPSGIVSSAGVVSGGPAISKGAPNPDARGFRNVEGMNRAPAIGPGAPPAPGPLPPASTNQGTAPPVGAGAPYAQPAAQGAWQPSGTGEQAITAWMQGAPMEQGLQDVLRQSVFGVGNVPKEQTNHYLAGGAGGYLPTDPGKFGWKWDGKNWNPPPGDQSGITWNGQTQRFEQTGPVGPLSVPTYGGAGAQQSPVAAGGIVNSGIGGGPGIPGGQPGPTPPGGQPGEGGLPGPGGRPYSAGGSNVVNGQDLSQFAPDQREYNPVMGQVEANQTVRGQLGDILKAGSPLLEAAKARAMQAANARGLQNSSMAAQAGEEALVNTALPIAQADAAAYQKQALVNQDITNQFLSMKEGAQLDLQKAYEAFKQNNFMFDKDEKLKRYLNDSQISSQEKVAAMQAAAQISAAQIHADSAIKAATLQADTELKAAGMRIDAEKVIEQARLTSQEKYNLANLSQNAFTNYVSGMNSILGAQMEPGDKDKWIKDYNTFWAGNGYLKDAGITIKLPGG